MSDGRTLFLKFDSATWTAKQLENLMEGIKDNIPEDVGVVAVPETLEYMDEEQVEELTATLIEVLEGGDD